MYNGAVIYSYLFMSDQPNPANPPSANQPPEAKKEAPPSQGQSVDINRIYGALSYFGLLLIIPLLLARDNDFVKFHLQQGIAWFVLWVVASLIMWIPFIGWSLWLVMFAISVYAAIQAYEGKRWEMPYLSKYAKQIKL